MSEPRLELTHELLHAALSVPDEASAPAGLRRSIVGAFRETPQRPAPLSARLAGDVGSLPLAARLALTALLLAVLLAGLAFVGSQFIRPVNTLDGSSTFRGEAARTGVVVGPGPGGAMVQAWRHDLGGQILSSPAVVDGVVYAGADDGWFHALDLATGAELWRQEVPVVWSSPTVIGDLVVVGTEDQALVGLDRGSGRTVRRVALGAYASGSPTMLGNRIYVATSTERSRGRVGPDDRGEVMAIDLDRETIVWRQALPGPSTRSIATDGATLVVPTDVGIVVAFDAQSGAERWRFASEAVAADTPVIAGGKAFIAGLDFEGLTSQLWAVDLSSGEESWGYREPTGQTIVAPVVDGPDESAIVYAGTVEGNVIALRASDGSVLWRHQVGAEIATAPTMAGDILYVASNGGITAVDVRTNTTLGTYQIDGIPFSPTVAGPYLVVGTQTGSLYGLQATGESAAATPAPSLSTPVPTSTAALTWDPLTRPLTTVWATSGTDLGISGPFYMSIGPDGRPWVADSTRGRFLILDRDGSVVDTWEPTGDDALDLMQPDSDGWGAVAFLPDGGFVVTDSDHQRILRFDAARRRVASWGTLGSGPGEFVSPFGITLGPDGLVYVVDDPTCRVQVFDADGRYVRTVAGGPDYVDRCTNNVVVDSEGTVYLANGGRGVSWRITAFAPDGSIRHFGEGVLREPVLLAAGSDGALFATDGEERLHQFDRDGALLGSWSGQGLGLALIDPGGEILAAGSEGVIRRYAVPPCCTR